MNGKINEILVYMAGLEINPISYEEKWKKLEEFIRKKQDAFQVEGEGQ